MHRGTHAAPNYAQLCWTQQGVRLGSQVFQSISKEIMVRLSATQDQSAGASGQGGSTLRVGQTPAGGEKKKAACCS